MPPQMNSVPKAASPIRPSLGELSPAAPGPGSHEEGRMKRMMLPTHRSQPVFIARTGDSGGGDEAIATGGVIDDSMPSRR
jgi:hypothetical protein